MRNNSETGKNADENNLKDEFRFRWLAESIIDVMWVMNLQGRIIYVTPSVEKLQGYKPDDFLNLEMTDYLTKESALIVSETVRNKMMEDMTNPVTGVTIELEALHKDGSIIPVEVTAKFIRDKKGTPTGIVGVTRDITEKNKAVQQIRESEKRYKTIFEGASEGILIANTETKKFITANDAICKMFGYTLDEMLKMSVFDIHPKESIDFVISEFTAQAKGEKQLAVNLPCLRKDGTVFYADFNSAQIELEGIKCVVGFVTDITEQKLTHAKEKQYLNNIILLNEFAIKLTGLSHEENIYQHLADELYKITNTITGITDFSNTQVSTALAFAGISKKTEKILKILGRHPVGISFPADSDATERFKSGKLVRYEGGLYELSLKTVPKAVCRQLEKLIDLQQIYQIGITRGSQILGSATFLCGPAADLSQNNLIETLVYQFSIILHRRLTEEELVKAKEKAEEADKLKTAFLSNMSHEIRTPMNAIVGFSDLLTEPDISEDEKAEFAINIKNSSRILMNLINDIVDLAKIESGQITISVTECDVDLIMLECYSAIQETQKKKDKTGIKIRLNNKIKENKMIVRTDPLRVRQVITNLLDNALKFTDEGYIELGYKKTNENRIKFYVKDTGIGIKKEELASIFDRFRQSDYGHTRKYGGSGLGLTICRNLITLLGGEIWAESSPGKGSIFYFTLPLVAGEEKNLIKKDKDPDNIDFNWEGKNILIAEDEPLNFKYIEKVLKSTRANIIHAKNGKEAVALCGSEKPEIILMDIKMPEMDGYEATKKIREFNKDIPVIAVTAYAVTGEREKCIDAGCNEYLSKPVKKEILFGTLKRYLG